MTKKDKKNPICQGKLLSGSESAVLCDTTWSQLHGYVAVKFCDEGRKIYCPTWREKNPQ